MSDREIKDRTRDIECPVFETTAFTTPPPLGDGDRGDRHLGVATPP